MVVVGIPNSGKSTIINALRAVGVNKTNKVAKVGGIAGVTTKIQTRVKISEDPPIYLYDTPGIFDPHVASPLEGLNIALVGSTRDHLTESINVADYLLFRLNRSSNIKLYPKVLGLTEPTDDIQFLLHTLCKKHNFIIPKGSRVRDYLTPTGMDTLSETQQALVEQECFDVDRAAVYLIELFRKGHFGTLTLNDCSPTALEEYFTTSPSNE